MLQYIKLQSLPLTTEDYRKRLCPTCFCLLPKEFSQKDEAENKRKQRPCYRPQAIYSIMNLLILE